MEERPVVRMHSSGNRCLCYLHDWTDIGVVFLVVLVRKVIIDLSYLMRVTRYSSIGSFSVFRASFCSSAGCRRKCEGMIICNMVMCLFNTNPAFGEGAHDQGSKGGYREEHGRSIQPPGVGGELEAARLGLPGGEEQKEGKCKGSRIAANKLPVYAQVKMR